MARDRHGRALVLGDTDLAVPLHAAGVPVTVVSGRAAPARFSRYTVGWLRDPRPDEDALLAVLLDAAERADGPAVLYYQQDDDLLFASRRRDELMPALRFLLPTAELVEQLVDKAAFQHLAAELDLPVPPARRLDLTAGVPDLADVETPVLVKPLRRERTWDAVSSGKAVLVEGRTELEHLLGSLAPEHAAVMLQQPVLGPESRIESHHVYVDAAGEVAAEFTGRKLRTYPSAMGHSTALVTTDAPDVAELGRDVVRRIGLRGVAKLDFKRDPAGRLWLLEVNPRFNLWHHVGAAAGVNLPAFVWADLVGGPRPVAARARPGMRWCSVDRDRLAARDAGISLGAWLRWLATCETRNGLDLRDPGAQLASRLLVPAYNTVRRRSSRSA